MMSPATLLWSLEGDELRDVTELLGSRCTDCPLVLGICVWATTGPLPSRSKHLIVHLSVLQGNNSSAFQSLALTSQPLAQEGSLSEIPSLLYWTATVIVKAKIYCACPVPHTILSHLYTPSNVILTPSWWGRSCYDFLHPTVEETEAQYNYVSCWKFWGS